MKYVQQKGFTLIELMIVVAIIGILASIAIPSYNDYTARSQVSEAMVLSSSLKTGLADWFADRGSFPSEVASISSVTAGKYVSVITLVGDLTTGTMNINATMKTNGVNKALSGLVFSIATTSGARHWSCGSQTGMQSAFTTTILDKHLPSACK